MGAAIQPLPFGKYFLLERIATGGMAEIYKAKYRAEGGFEKTLVIKKILPHLAQDDEFVTMFRDEAALTVRLNHTNIVQVFDFGRTGEDYFLAMEYVQGQNLRAVMRRCQELGAPVPIPFALYGTTEVAKGLAYAHSRRDETDTAMQIVHRDITPSNILVSYEGEFKIADFGIAKAAARATGTQAGMIKGKASYLSPEQVLGKQAVDGRADIFALGAVLWEAVVGKKLFTGDSDFEIMNKITSEPIPKPSSRNAAIPPEIDTVVMKCLERDRDKRYSNASALQKDLTVLQTKFAGNITTVDISNFLRRLFKKEMEAEKEASKSFARAPLPNEAALIKAANEGATLAEPGTRGGIAAPARKGSSMATIAIVVALAAMAALAAVAVSRFGKGPSPVETPLAAISPTPLPIASAAASPEPTVSVVTQSSPAPTETAAIVATPHAARSPVVRASPAATAKPTAAAMATPVDASGNATGVVKIDSDPWGEIFVDGKDTGRQTPAFDLKLSEGRHEIRLVNSVRKLEARVTVFVDAKNAQKIAVKLAPIQ